MHDEDTGRSDDDVVDRGAASTGPGDVVQDLEAVGAEPLKGRTDEMPAALTVFQVPCSSS
jgi:hypothetical protein